MAKKIAPHKNKIQGGNFKRVSRHGLNAGWAVSAKFVEPGASQSDMRRHRKYLQYSHTDFALQNSWHLACVEILTLGEKIMATLEKLM
jgi:hypothetical protein